MALRLRCMSEYGTLEEYRPQPTVCWCKCAEMHAASGVCDVEQPQALVFFDEAWPGLKALSVCEPCARAADGPHVLTYTVYDYTLTSFEWDDSHLD